MISSQVCAAKERRSHIICFGEDDLGKDLLKYAAVKVLLMPRNEQTTWG